MDDRLTFEQIEEWRKKICNKIFADFCDDHQTEHRKSLEREFNALCDLALSALRQDSSGGVTCAQCKGSGTITVMSQGLGPNDYEEDATCQNCNGTGVAAHQESRSEVLELLNDARFYILNKAGRHDLNWRDGYEIIERIDAIQGLEMPSQGPIPASRAEVAAAIDAALKK